MFHTNLKAKRLQSGMSQKQVADFLNVSAQSVSKWEKGVALPSIAYLPKLATCLNCDINSFFDEEKSRLGDFNIVNAFFELMTNVLNEDDCRTEDVADFVLKNPDAIELAISLCKNLMQYKTVNIRMMRNILGCSETEAKTFVDYLVRCEMLESLDIQDTYFVMKDAIEGYILVIKIQKKTCDIINQIKQIEQTRQSS